MFEGGIPSDEMIECKHKNNVVYANGQRKSKNKIFKAVNIQRDIEIKVNETFIRLPFVFLYCYFQDGKC